MIKPNELRIGNFVLDNFYINDLRKLTEISLEDFVAISHGCNSYQPIPLTEDILTKCGFTKVVREYFMGDLPWELNDIFIGKYGEGYYLCFETLDRDDCSIFGDMGNQFSYLHQLQNLYFALTGEELKFNN